MPTSTTVSLRINKARKMYKKGCKALLCSLFCMLCVLCFGILRFLCGGAQRGGGF